MWETVENLMEMKGVKASDVSKATGILINSATFLPLVFCANEKGGGCSSRLSRKELHNERMKNPYDAVW